MPLLVLNSTWQDAHHVPKARVPEQLGCVDHYKELASEDASTCPPATCSNAEVGPKVEDVGSVDASQKCTLRIDYDLSCTKRSVEMKCSLRTIRKYTANEYRLSVPHGVERYRGDEFFRCHLLCNDSVDGRGSSLVNVLHVLQVQA